MELVVPRSDEKRGAHLQELVSLATEDIARGEEVLPRALYDKLVALQQSFGKKYQWLSRKSGVKAEAIALRNKTNKRLSYLVRDIFIMARRKYERGDINGHAISLHCIPKGTVHAKGQANFWIGYAGQILAGDTEWTKTNQTILLDPSRSILEAAQKQARIALNEANRAISEVSKLQTQMQELRQEVNHLLAQARQYLVAAHFGLEPAKLRDVLFAYGYRFRPGRRQAATEPQPPMPKEPKRIINQQETAFTYSPPKVDPTLLKGTTPPVEPTAPKVMTPSEPSHSPESHQDPDLKAAITIEEPKPTPDLALDPDLKAAITIEEPKPKKGIQTRLDQIQANAAKRKANAQARYGDNKPKRKKRPKKSK